MAQSNDSASKRSRTGRDQPQDRFDAVERSGRVGAHRVTARPRYVWQYLVAGLLGFALLTGVGIIAVKSIGGTSLPIGTPSKSETREPAVEAELDPEATIAILNGTTTQGLAATLDSIITQEGWGQILFSGAAAASDVEISAVFYRDPADEGIAKGLASKLGGISTYHTEEYAEYDARLIVLLGSDYGGPGLDEAGQDPATEEPAPEPEIDPGTGFPIDPETGYAVDPETGQAYDPATGQPIQ